MMEQQRLLSSFVPFIEFVGAFNFAFALTSFSKKFRDSILSIDNRYESEFKAVDDEWESNKRTLDLIKPIKTTDGRSTQARLEKLQKNSERLQQAKNDARIEVKKEIELLYREKAFDTMFLMLGIYTILDLLFIGLCEFYGHSEFVCFWSATFNVFSLLYALYFVVCEIWHYLRRKGPRLRRFFCPTKLSTLYVSLAFLVVSLIISLILIVLFECTGTFGHDAYMDYTFFLAFGLPILAFIASCCALGFYYKKSKGIIKKRAAGIISGIKAFKEDMKKLTDLSNNFEPIKEDNFDMEK